VEDEEQKKEDEADGYDPKIVRTVQDTEGKFGGYAIFCPACKFGHLFDSRWTFNGNMEKPTFRASMLIPRWDSTDETKYRTTLRCHSFVTDGMIQFLDDSEHDLRGQTVPLEPF
jgi:hypothetical protein